MKKQPSIPKICLLALLSIFVLFSSCSNQPHSGDISKDCNSHTSDIENTNSSEVTDQETAIMVNRNYYPLNLAKGKSYKNSKSPDEKYTDKGKMLTDGVRSDLYDGQWVGYSNSAGLQITLDLGKVEEGLADFTVRILRTLSYTFGIPRRINVEISENDTEYTSIGFIYPSNDLLDTNASDVGLKLKYPVSARYVRFTFGSNESMYLVLGEIEVIKYVEEYEPVIKPYYTVKQLPEIKENDEWPENEQNDKNENLIAGKLPYMVASGTDMTDSPYATEYYNTKQMLGVLTNGYYSTPDGVGGNGFAHFTRHGSRTIIYDLSHISAISGAQFSFLQNIPVGINLPDCIRILLSENGNDWQCVYSNNDLLCELNGMCRETVSFDGIFRARFVKIEFSLITHVYCDELQIYGTKKIPDDAIRPKANTNDSTEEYPGYITPDKLMGVENILLSYNCFAPENGEHPESGLASVDEYMPYVGYYDNDGKLCDTFFDGFLYLPYGKFSTTEGIRTLEGWKYYLDDVYKKDRNMDALDQAIGKVKNELGKNDYRGTVFTSILYPGIYPGLGDPIPFGDLDGDGVSDDFDSFENQKAAIRWMMDECYSRFNAYNFENLTFGGFYWYDEILITHNANERELVRYASDYAHSLGTSLIWIPYNSAAGYDRFADYGIDVACMQPNYMFGLPLDSIEQVSELAKRYGMGIEMEISTITRNEDIRRYMKYLEGGVKYGYINGVKMYYQEGVPGGLHEACYSNVPYARSVYDLTYKYAKKLLKNETPEFTMKQTEFTCNGKTLQSRIVASSDTYRRYSIAVSPCHGSLCLNANGIFIYYPDEGFRGVDTFSIKLDFGYIQSENIEITVNVEGK